MRYFKVTVIRGHLGVGYMHGSLTFFECAHNAIQAMDKARRHGGVKHGRMPLSCNEISKAEYEQGRKVSAYRRENS